MLITPDNKLLITTGDDSNTGNARNASSLNGKILRINLDGSIPADNPVAGNPYWTYGHHNPEGMCTSNGAMMTVYWKSPGQAPEITAMFAFYQYIGSNDKTWTQHTRISSY